MRYFKLINTTEHKILARKYRPRSFSELVGQESILNTISNSIESNRISQAYLFTGIRGVGKTTIARVLARTLNYTLDNIEYSPSITLENIGLNCEAIMESRHPDVFEMDAASNTGIDNVREIINFAQTRPTMAKYKIFIIDEVHMLSRQAFNGLLKILEEPPEHVIFIFATTEIEKIPVTILSRCQKFNLQRIDSEIMIKYVFDIAQKEKVEINEKSVQIICSASEGSMRDALSILDQAISLCDGNISEDKLADMLNLNDMNFIIELFEKLILSEIDQIKKKIDQIYENGFEPISLIRDLSRVTHLASLIKIKIQVKNNYLSSDQIEKINSIIQNIDISSLIHMWQMLLRGYNEVMESFDNNVALEMLLIKLCYSSQLPPIDSLISKFEDSMDGEKNKVLAKEIKIDIKIPESYDEVKSMIIDNDIRLAGDLEKFELIEYKIGHIDLTSNDMINNATIKQIESSLKNLTNMEWTINYLGEKTENVKQITIDNIKQHYPDAQIVNEDEI
ncbi:MAG: DNA polymerase III, subunit gamma and tau [Rhodobiaceae bacterium]|nr:DNA polymerase III, subunit gamma and tau [Rhodobiaceae bacterium]|tara:strand:+ start:15216 stop:16739 length:1524 start_codon:yes stop_codon:yes gene_type:complete